VRCGVRAQQGVQHRTVDEDWDEDWDGDGGGDAAKAAGGRVGGQGGECAREVLDSAAGGAQRGAGGADELREAWRMQRAAVWIRMRILHIDLALAVAEWWKSG
jgi:hypothetical protein